MSRHPLVKYLEGVTDAGRVQGARAAAVRAGGARRGRAARQPPEYVQRLNRLLVRLAAPGRAGLTPRRRESLRTPSGCTLAGPGRGTEALIETPLRRGRRPRGARLRRGLPSASAATAARWTTRWCGPWRARSSSWARPPSVSTSAVSARATGSYDEGRGRDRRCARGDRLRSRALAAARRCGSRGFPSAAWLRYAPRPRRSPRGSSPWRPASPRSSVAMRRAPDCPWLIVQGDADDVVPPQAVLEWARTLSPAPSSRCCPAPGTSFTAASTSCATRCWTSWERAPAR